jgi:hypothetical protein
VTNRRALLLSPLGLIVALVTFIAGGTASAAANAGPETRVRANRTAVETTVAADSNEIPASVECLRPAQPETVVGACVATKALPAGPGTGGTLRVAGNGFSASKQRMAQLLYEQGNDVVLRQATGAGRTSDLLLNGVAYDVYTPTSGNVNAIVSAIAKKGSQVNGGGVVLDLSSSPLTPAQVGNLLPRVQGVTDQISDIIVVG